MDSSEKERLINEIVDGRIKEGNYRYEVQQFVARDSRNVLEYGFGDASLLLGLRRDKGVRGIYGIEVDKAAFKKVEGLLDKAWLIDLNKEDAWLEPEYEGFFNYILAPMSLEHTYDPWYILKKFNKYLADKGKVIVEVPNAQSWEVIYRLLTGDFPYVSGGTWDFTHIRWYTLKSLMDISAVAGFRLRHYQPRVPENVSVEHLGKRKNIRTLRMPPPESGLKSPPIDVKFPMDIDEIYHLFLAHVLVVVLEKEREPEDFMPTRSGGYLESYRLACSNPLSVYSDLIMPPYHSMMYERARGLADKLKEKWAEKTDSPDSDGSGGPES